MLKLPDIMTREVITVSPELTLRDAMELLTTKHVSGAPVVAGGKVVGVVSVTDLLSFAASQPGVPTERTDQSEWGNLPGWENGTEPPGTYFTEMWSDAGAEVDERFREETGPEWNVLEEHTVAEVMTRRICSLPSSAEVPEAADYMRRAGIHRLLVMDDGQLGGIVSAMDIAKAVAEHQLTTRTYVFNRERDFDERGEWQGPAAGE